MDKICKRLRILAIPYLWMDKQFEQLAVWLIEQVSFDNGSSAV